MPQIDRPPTTATTQLEWFDTREVCSTDRAGATTQHSGDQVCSDADSPATIPTTDRQQAAAAIASADLGSVEDLQNELADRRVTTHLASGSGTWVDAAVARGKNRVAADQFVSRVALSSYEPADIASHLLELEPEARRLAIVQLIKERPADAARFAAELSVLAATDEALPNGKHIHDAYDAFWAEVSADAYRSTGPAWTARNLSHSDHYQRFIDNVVLLEGPGSSDVRNQLMDLFGASKININPSTWDGRAPYARYHALEATENGWRVEEFKLDARARSQPAQFLDEMATALKTSPDLYAKYKRTLTESPDLIYRSTTGPNLVSVADTAPPYLKMDMLLTLHSIPGNDRAKTDAMFELFSDPGVYGCMLDEDHKADVGPILEYLIKADPERAQKLIATIASSYTQSSIEASQANKPERAEEIAHDLGWLIGETEAAAKKALLPTRNGKDKYADFLAGTLELSLQLIPGFGAVGSYLDNVSGDFLREAAGMLLTNSRAFGQDASKNDWSTERIDEEFTKHYESIIRHSYDAARYPESEVMSRPIPDPDRQAYIREYRTFDRHVVSGYSHGRAGNYK